MPASPEYGGDFLALTPVLTAATGLAAAALYKTTTLALNKGGDVYERLRYGPATDPHTWPSFERLGLENPNHAIAQQRVKEILNHTTPEQQREIDERIAFTEAMFKAWPELAGR